MGMPPTKSTAQWLSPNDAAELLGTNPNYVSKLGREKKIRVKKAANNRNLYSKADVTKLAANRPRRAKAKPKAPPNGVKNGEKNGTPVGAARMTPKQAQTAVQKARWVFDGITMGAITSDAEALSLLRNVLYEGNSQ
jgi:hypothetical protein